MSFAFTAENVVCEVTGLADVLHALRARAEELDIGRLTIDEIAGLSLGHASKGLADPPMKRMSIDTAALIAGSTGMKLILVKDPDAVVRMGRRWTKRDAKKANTRAIGTAPWERAGELRRAQNRRAGKARSRSMSKPERVELSRKGGLGRAAALPARRLSEIARTAGLASAAARRERASVLASLNQIAET